MRQGDDIQTFYAYKETLDKYGNPFLLAEGCFFLRDPDTHNGDFDTARRFVVSKGQFYWMGKSNDIKAGWAINEVFADQPIGFAYYNIVLYSRI